METHRRELGSGWKTSKWQFLITNGGNPIEGPVYLKFFSNCAILDAIFENIDPKKNVVS